MLPRTLFGAAIFVAASVLSIDARAGTTFDAAADFMAFNPNGAWSYGEGQTGSTFTFLSSYELFDTTVVGWGTPQSAPARPPYVAINPSSSTIDTLSVVVPTGVLDLHPGPSTDAIVRWTAPKAGIYTFNGFFEILDTHPTGITGLIVAGGTPIYGRTLLGPPADQGRSAPGGKEIFSFVRTLDAGQIVDFGVNNLGDFSNDSTGFDVSIAPAPEPQVWMDMILGFGAAGLVLRRRRADRAGAGLRQRRWAC